MSFLFIYSPINYYTALSSLTLGSCPGRGSSGSAARAAGQGSGVCLVAPLQCRGTQQLLAPLGLQQSRAETITGYSTSALARLISPLKASFPAQHPVLAIPSAFPNAMQTAQGSLVTRPAQEEN